MTQISIFRKSLLIGSKIQMKCLEYEKSVQIKIIKPHIVFMIYSIGEIVKPFDQKSSNRKSGIKKSILACFLHDPSLRIKGTLMRNRK